MLCRKLLQAFKALSLNLFTKPGFRWVIGRSRVRVEVSPSNLDLSQLADSTIKWMECVPSSGTFGNLVDLQTGGRRESSGWSKIEIENIPPKDEESRKHVKEKMPSLEARPAAREFLHAKS